MDNLYSDIFKITFNKQLQDLNYENTASIRNTIQELRRNFRSEKCDTVYETEDQRKAYMISYFPYYIMPVYNILNKYILPQKKEIYKNKNIINLTYFAGGPCPELVGTLMAMKHNEIYRKCEVKVLDYEGGWRNQRKVTAELINRYFYNLLKGVKAITGCDILRDCDDCDDESCISDIFEKTDICFMQNCLNHMNNDDEFIEKLMKKIKYFKDDTVFVIIDLNYDIVLDILKKLYVRIKSCVNIIGTNIYQEPERVECPFKLPDELIKYVFNGENLLIPRRYTSYYYLAFTK